jgi:hypothetical protein
MRVSVVARIRSHIASVFERVERVIDSDLFRFVGDGIKTQKEDTNKQRDQDFVWCCFLH